MIVGMIIRDFDPSDLHDAAYLYVDVFNGEPWRDQWSFESARQRLADAHQTPGFVGVSLRDERGTVIGFAVGNLEQWFTDHQYYLREMCVDRRMQRLGLGSRLLAAIQERTPTVSVSYLLTARETPAHAFYEAHGFAIARRQVVLTKRLSPID
jgi:aminoglycoside 6'-N-acetyltransferase I